MKLLSSFFTLLILLSTSICLGQAQERLLLSALTTSKKLMLFDIVYANKKYTVLKQASFNLPVQGGTTAIAPLPNDRFQILWTQGLAQTRIKYLIADSNLNKVSNIKTLPPVVDYHIGFNYVPSAAVNSFSMAAGMAAVDSTKISFRASGNIVLKNRNEMTGLVSGPNDIVFPVQQYSLLIDFDFSRTHLGETKYGGIHVDYGMYLFVCGNVNDQAPSAVHRFEDEILNATILPIPNSNNFNFIVMKRTRTPERISIENFQVNGNTCRFLKNTLLLPPVNQNLSPTLFLGLITSVASDISRNGSHVAVIRSAADSGSNIFMFHENTLQGNKDSPGSLLFEDEVFTDRHFYGIALASKRNVMPAR